MKNWLNGELKTQETDREIYWNQKKWLITKKVCTRTQRKKKVTIKQVHLDCVEEVKRKYLTILVKRE